MDHPDYEVRWIRTGAIAGVWACFAYPMAVFVPMPLRATAAVAASFGPALAIGCVGLWRLIRLYRPSVAASAAAGLNGLGGGLFAAMVLVQMAVGHATGGRTEGPLQAVWLGLDVAWDAYIGLGTVLFGVSMFGHPRFGRLFGTSGIVLALGLLASNLYTFPTPPANAGLVDFGPFIGLWYLAVSIQVWRSVGWAKAAAGRARA
jgi:hypothetical protein